MDTTTKKILVVEDEDVLRNTLVDNLTAEGFNVISAVNGEEGLAMALKENPDLILVDIVMPQMDGIVMAQKIKAQKGDRVPMIILTNFDDPEHIRRAVDSNIFDYFVKTEWRIQDIMTAVKKKLGLKNHSS